jgi:hypothetical protein
MINSEIILEYIVKIVKDEKNSDIGFSKIYSYLCENFPELKENEDKKIRKELIDFLQETIDNVGEYSPNNWENKAKKWIAWLEKQSRQKAVDCENTQQKDIVQEPEPEDERIRNWCISHFKECIRVSKINVEYQKYLSNKVIPWLEKQGEQKNLAQKPITGDERIRKGLIHAVSGTLKGNTLFGTDVTREEALSWLEKQGKNSQCRSIIEAWKDMRLEVYQQASGNRHEPNYSDDSTKMFSLNDIDEIIEKINEQTEKQDYESQDITESKPAVGTLADEIKFPFKAKVKKSNKIIVITGGQLDDAQPIESRSYLAYTSDITDGYKVYKPEELEFIKQPGFKVGDWVVNKLGDAWHIDSFYGENYQVSNGKGNFSYFPISKQDEMHLWTIRDAKEGDVLVDAYGNIGIYEKCDYSDWRSYCSLGHNGGFQHFKTEHENEKTYPATKEQRDALEKAITNAGYSWDGELKKNTKFSKGDWIYRGTGDPYFVESVFNEQYELCSGFGYHFNKGIDEVDGDYRLWNINDAKLGDILADDDKTIALYEEQSTKTFFHVLCYYCNKTFVPKKGTLAVLGFHPATKEQREFFSNELKKSGYNLDLEKKQLADQPKLTKFEQSLKHIIEEALDDGDTHNLKADAELLLSVANQDRAKIELTIEEEDALDQAIISLNDMFDDSQPETCYAGHHVPFDVAAKCLSSLKDKILNSK